ncbi:MAG: hypothetical protein FK733_02280 [Asgard group archaeon]|nr:hypothetical protein [Asgard group archaeon]
MNKAVYYKVMFISSGIYSIVAAILFGVLAHFQFFMDLLGITSPKLADTNGAIIWMYCFLLLIGIYGFMFILVGIDITKNHLVISSGMIAKILFFIILLVFFILNACDWPVLILGGIDLIWTALFIEFYVNFKKLDHEDIVGAYPYKITE